MAMDGATGVKLARPSLSERLEASLGRPLARRSLLAAVAFFSLALGLGSIGLWGARESRLAACVSDILREGNWLLPNLWGRPRLEKPPLPYWIVAAAPLLTGRFNEWTLRLPGILAALVVVGSVYRLGAAAGPRVGLLAALFLLTSFYFVSELRQPSSDLFLTAFSSAALACWWRGQHAVGEQGRWWAAAGVLIGLAMASKGPVALAVVLPPLAGFLAGEHALALPRSRAALVAIALAVAIGVAWPAAVLTLRNQAWVTWINQLDNKVSQGSSPASWRAVWFYVIEWPQYLFPWSVFALAGVRLGFLRRSGSVPPVVRFAWFWFFGNMLVFTLFSIRKIYYLMPAVPGLAIVAAYVAETMAVVRETAPAERLRRVTVRAQLGLLAAAGLALAGLAWYSLDGPWRWPGTLAGSGVALALAVNYIRHRRRAAVIGPCLAAAVVLSVAIGVSYAWLLPALDASQSHRAFVTQVSARIPRGEPVYFWGEPDPSYWFYLDRPLRPITEVYSENRRTAYCLVDARDVAQEPALARRFEVLAAEPLRDGKHAAVLGRVALPRRPLPIFTAMSDDAARTQHGDDAGHGDAEREARTPRQREVKR